MGRSSLVFNIHSYKVYSSGQISGVRILILLFVDVFLDKEDDLDSALIDWLIQEKSMIQKSQCIAIDKLCKHKGKTGEQELKVDNSVRYRFIFNIWNFSVIFMKKNYFL